MIAPNRGWRRRALVDSGLILRSLAPCSGIMINEANQLTMCIRSAIVIHRQLLCMSLAALHYILPTSTHIYIFYSKTKSRYQSPPSMFANEAMVFNPLLHDFVEILRGGRGVDEPIETPEA